jgi:hypothetical protein
MNRDRIPYLVAFVLVLVGGIWVARNTYWEETLIPLPPQGEAATNPYYSVQHLATSLGIRSSFMTSLKAAPPANGALLVDGFQGDMTHTRLDDLFTWVESGGRLIVTDDVLLADPKFQDWSDIHLSHRLDLPEKKKPTAARPISARSDPDADCAPLSVAIDGVATGTTLTLCKPPREFGLITKGKPAGRPPAWSLANEFGQQVLRVNIGRGSVTVLPRYALISNRNLIRHDHAEIFITASHLTRGDVLYIVNAAPAEGLIALIWRLAAPALVFFGAAVLCIILRELPRFGPPLPAPAMVRRSLAEQIRANAAFAWRTRKLSALRAAVRRALDETAKRRIAAYSSLDVRRRVSAIAACAGTDAKTLNAAMTEDAVAAPQVQRAAIALLEQTRRLLNAEIQKNHRGHV